MRVPSNYAVTRKQKRYIAKEKMKEKEIQDPCKHSYITTTRGNFVMQKKVPSYFSEHWKDEEYQEVFI